MHEPQGMFIGRCVLEGFRRERWGATIDRKRDLYCGADVLLRSMDGRFFDPELYIQLTYLLHDSDKLRSFIYRFANKGRWWKSPPRVFVGLEDNGRNTQVLVNAIIREHRERYAARAPHRGSIEHLEILADGTATWRSAKAHLRHLYERRAAGFNGPRQVDIITRVNGSAFFVDESNGGRDSERLIYYTSVDREKSRPLVVGARVDYALMGKSNRGLPVGEYARVID
jgi:hypothetical protein